MGPSVSANRNTRHPRAIFATGDAIGADGPGRTVLAVTVVQLVCSTSSPGSVRTSRTWSPTNSV